jgi:methylmalonyl-CoA mutase
MTFPVVGVAAWRAQVDKDLAGAPFDKVLVHRSPEGLAIQPLYTEALPEAGRPGVAPFTRGAHATPAPFRICMRHQVVDEAALVDDLAGGAEALWLGAGVDLDHVLGRADSDKVAFLVDGGPAPLAVLAALVEGAARRDLPLVELLFALGADPVGGLAMGRAPSGTLADELGDLGQAARFIAERCPHGHTALVSTLPYHAAGADAADELALALSTGAVYLGALLDAGLDPTAAARQLAVQISVGRDTFAELCKLRALRLVWHKLLAAAGAPAAPLALLHAVAGSRTLSERDPWVNMLRAATQTFAAVLGGADWVTPATFDEALGTPGALGRRVARNTGLVLREESHLGRVVDAAGGSYYMEALTDALAREAWSRFRALERSGGVVAALKSGSLAAQLDAAWLGRKEALARRKEPLLGVSEFANLDEKLPARPVPQLPVAASTDSPELRVALAAVESARSSERLEALIAAANAGAGAAALIDAALRPAQELALAPLPRHRDAEPFEALRRRAEALAAAGRAPAIVLDVLGPPAEHRARLGFATAFFATGGVRPSADATIACLCGSDERYAAEAAERTRALKAAGIRRVYLAGRPGALEPALRAAGVDGFVFVGSDAVATLSEILDASDGKVAP